MNPSLGKVHLEERIRRRVDVLACGCARRVLIKHGPTRLASNETELLSSSEIELRGR